jgi:hypothetical protein
VDVGVLAEVREVRGRSMRAKAVVVKCNGEAHSTPWIDNCWSCAPYWEQIPLCPMDGKKLLNSGYCRHCRKYYNVEGV